jgi:hypothetical protein
MNFSSHFFISVYFKKCPSYSYFERNEKDELAISFNRRICSYFSDSLALFETLSEAKNFLSTLKVDENRVYQISATSRQPKQKKLRVSA